MTFFTFNGCISRLRTRRFIFNSHQSPFASFKRSFHHQNNPFIHSRSQQVKFHNTSQLLWSYFKAPTNLLFITTNLIGLGIVTTYRGMHVLANSDAEDYKLDSNTIDSVAPDKGTNWAEHHGQMINLEYHFQKSLEQSERTVATEHDDDLLIFPITEKELSNFGPGETLDIPKDRVSYLIGQNLLHLGEFYGQLRVMIRKKQQYEKAFELANSKTPINRGKSYKKHMENGTLFDFFRDHQTLRNKLFSDINKQITLNFMKKKEYTASKKLSKSEFEKGFQKIVMQHASVPTLQPKFLLRMSELFSSCNDPDYLWIYKTLNPYRGNQNFQVLLNTLSLSMIRQATVFITTEEMFYEILRNAVLSANKLIFEKCLFNLNLTKGDLKRMNFTKRATKIIKNITKGEGLFNITFSLKTYMLALHGMVKMKYNQSILTKATKKVITSLQTRRSGESRVSFALIPTNSKRCFTAKVHKTLLECVPLELVDFSTKIALHTKDQYIMTWCILAVSRSNSLDNLEKIKRLNALEANCDNSDLKLLIQKLQEILLK